MVFSSTTFSGMRSANHKNVQGGGPKPRVLQRPFYVLTPGSRPTPALLPLTLVLDEAMSCQQLQRVHLKEHSVEEKVVGGGPAGRVPGQAGEDEFLGGREERQVGGKLSLSRGSLKTLDPSGPITTSSLPRDAARAFLYECTEEKASH